MMSCPSCLPLFISYWPTSLCIICSVLVSLTWLLSLYYLSQLWTYFLFLTGSVPLQDAQNDPFRTLCAESLKLSPFLVTLGMLSHVGFPLMSHWGTTKELTLWTFCQNHAHHTMMSHMNTIPWNVISWYHTWTQHQGHVTPGCHALAQHQGHFIMLSHPGSDSNCLRGSGGSLGGIQRHAISSCWSDVIGGQALRTEVLVASCLGLEVSGCLLDFTVQELRAVVSPCLRRLLSIYLCVCAVPGA